MSSAIDWDMILERFPQYETLLDLFMALRAEYWDCESIAPILGVSHTSLYHKMKAVGVPFNRHSCLCPECKKRHAPCRKPVSTVRVIWFPKKK